MKQEQYSFSKKNPDDKTIWVEIEGREQALAFTFDRKKIYFLYQDYPEKLTPEEKKIFDRENPYWANLLG